MLKTFAREIVANSAISAPDFDTLPAAAARIARARWQEWIENATRDAVERVVQPANALAREAAPADIPHPISSVVRRIRVASPYDYFPEIVEQYAQRKGITEINAESLTSLLRRIDQRMTEGFSPEEWVSLAEPLFEFGRAHPTGAVPVGLIQRFLEVRGADTLVSRIPEEGNLTVEVFREKLGVASEPGGQGPETVPEPVEAPGIDFPSPMLGAGDGAIASDRSSDDPSEPTLAEFFGGSETEAEETEAKTTNGDASTPLWKRFLSKDAPAESAEERSAELIAARASAGQSGNAESEESFENLPLWKRFSQPSRAAIEVAPEPEVETTVSSEPLPAEEPEMDVADIEPQPWTLEDLEEAVLGDAAGEWRSLYVDSLFKGKEEQYERVLGELRLALDWPAASDIIAKEVFKKNKVDIYAVPAVAFTDAVEARYKGEDSVD